MRSPDQAKGQIVFRLHRPLTFQRAILVDTDLDVHSVDEVCGWVKDGADVVVIDGDTGEDVTRIVFAHWEDGCLVDPIGERRG
jgi:hypothetical protein